MTDIFQSETSGMTTTLAFTPQNALVKGAAGCVVRQEWCLQAYKTHWKTEMHDED